jgi:hypothetical protein
MNQIFRMIDQIKVFNQIIKLVLILFHRKMLLLKRKHRKTYLIVLVKFKILKKIIKILKTKFKN